MATLCQASDKASASAGTIPPAAWFRLQLKDGSCATPGSRSSIELGLPATFRLIAFRITFDRGGGMWPSISLVIPFGCESAPA
jgi:hypothetical protein